MTPVNELEIKVGDRVSPARGSAPFEVAGRIGTVIEIKGKEVTVRFRGKNLPPYCRTITFLSHELLVQAPLL
jgi:hypothetical protein